MGERTHRGDGRLLQGGEQQGEGGHESRSRKDIGDKPVAELGGAEVQVAQGTAASEQHADEQRAAQGPRLLLSAMAERVGHAAMRRRVRQRVDRQPGTAAALQPEVVDDGADRHEFESLAEQLGALRQGGLSASTAGPMPSSLLALLENGHVESRLAALAGGVGSSIALAGVLLGLQGPPGWVALTALGTLSGPLITALLLLSGSMRLTLPSLKSLAAEDEQRQGAETLGTTALLRTFAAHLQSVAATTQGATGKPERIGRLQARKGQLEQVAELLRGDEARAQSALGQGTRQLVTLPLMKNLALVCKAQANALGPQLTIFRMLVPHFLLPADAVRMFPDALDAAVRLGALASSLELRVNAAIAQANAEMALLTALLHLVESHLEEIKVALATEGADVQTNLAKAAEAREAGWNDIVDNRR